MQWPIFYQIKILLLLVSCMVRLLICNNTTLSMRSPFHGSNSHINYVQTFKLQIVVFQTVCQDRLSVI